MPGVSSPSGQIRYLTDKISGIRDRAGSSNSLALAIVFFTNLVDNLLLTSVVPVIPALLLQQDRQEFDHTNSAPHSTNGTGNCQHEARNLSSTHEEQPPAVFSLTSVAVTENSRVGWLLSSKAVVQILANFMIGQLCYKVGYPLILLTGSLVIFLSSLGMSIIARRYQDDQSRSRAMGIAMSGGACGVLVGYPFGGFMYNFVGKTAAFLIIATSILIDAEVLQGNHYDNDGEIKSGVKTWLRDKLEAYCEAC
ncbi:synaptic vesicular amine transporter [Elysia marginata]|uniref:Synaptic vesicular amine transporter n=1 Tax=Elysia marginata TaxID=1093978 RepID=A0AAV4II79_9GAST|nr:synaptic vesicular amine transporter [Elysia marginata]